MDAYTDYYTWKSSGKTNFRKLKGYRNIKSYLKRHFEITHNNFDGLLKGKQQKKTLNKGSGRAHDSSKEGNNN